MPGMQTTSSDTLKELRAVNRDFYPQSVVEMPMTGPVKSDIKVRDSVRSGSLTWVTLV